MEDFIRLANQFGIPWAFAGATIVGVWKIAKYVTRQLVNDERAPSGVARGLINQVAEQHIKTMQTMAAEMVAQTELVREQTRLLHETAAKINCPRPSGPPANISG